MRQKSENELKYIAAMKTCEEARKQWKKAPEYNSVVFRLGAELGVSITVLLLIFYAILYVIFN